MQLILLAAGKGTRLPKNLRNNPKCLTKINDKTILEHNIKFFNSFKKKIIITGYKSVLLKEFIEENNFKEVKNKNFKKTNMVYSAFKCCKIIKSDVVICYSDIIFDHKIYFNLKKKKNIIPLKENWLDIWKQRMSLKEIKKDAEYVEVKHNKLISIGETIKKKMPKYQYMGLIKLKYLEYQKLSKFFFQINNKKINFTNFINLAIKNNKVKFEVIFTKKKMV